MAKTILITGATDGIGLVTAMKLAKLGHDLIIHGRNSEKLADANKQIDAVGSGKVISLMADFSSLTQVSAMADEVINRGYKIDVLINNAGVFRTATPLTAQGMDVRFTVNTIAPYLLTRKLLSVFNAQARVLNLSSAAQASIDFDALQGQKQLDDMAAYAQSKTAITMWTKTLSRQLQDLVLLAINPGSLLASKMVKQGFGVAGKNLAIGADILVEMALSDTATAYSGDYFDNDAGRFSSPHSDVLDDELCSELIAVMDKEITKI
ncbi:SDR family NAD(P)-dependent oxidoreductase [Psychrobium sp. MM17-31]|uniref:SDR family NAD(P)-dependent oxidoreductase n=1 Tax=Psychrobium sp. MM17-31 TaxID=2917758 RepID=UPI001EF51641|nr:SDR family NAD(P)-dependent oxidoreductase [Psychrobium sp. MM17-31]MCG7530386.1 SDR family NAD(P)-dependent oxidoreductase [Psychrobium sp. MM17-31]